MHKQTFLFIEMINKAGNLRWGMAGIEHMQSKSYDWTQLELGNAQLCLGNLAGSLWGTPVPVPEGKFVAFREVSKPLKPQSEGDSTHLMTNTR